MLTFEKCFLANDINRFYKRYETQRAQAAVAMSWQELRAINGGACTHAMQVVGQGTELHDADRLDEGKKVFSQHLSVLTDQGRDRSVKHLLRTVMAMCVQLLVSHGPMDESAEALAQRLADVQLVCFWGAAKFSRKFRVLVNARAHTNSMLSLGTPQTQRAVLLAPTLPSEMLSRESCPSSS